MQRRAIVVHTILTLLPSLLMLCLVAATWPTVEAILFYAPPLVPIMLTLVVLPLVIQVSVYLKRSFATTPQTVRTPHPFGLLLPLSLLLLAALWPLGEWTARQIPPLCRVWAHDEAKPEQPGKAHFAISAFGWGNPQSFKLTGATIIYTMYPNDRRMDDLHIKLPEWQGYYYGEMTERREYVYFPLTKDRVLAFVQGSDDFPEAEAKALADKLWRKLRNIAEKRDLPPMRIMRHRWNEHNLVYHAPSTSICLVAVALDAVGLTVIAFLMARWYCRRLSC